MIVRITMNDPDAPKRRKRGASALGHLGFDKIQEHYERRNSISRKLRRFLKAENVEQYTRLALGISDATGNYSAWQHMLGPQILAGGREASVFALAQRLNSARAVGEMLAAIYEANVHYLKIGVGSEMAMMLQPEIFWVANTRTVWAHLLLKHDFSYRKAQEEYELYRGQNPDSEMSYRIWRDIYPSMKNSFETLEKLGREEALAQGMADTHRGYLWPDAIANELYEIEFSKR